MKTAEAFATNAIKYGTRAKFGMMLPSVNAIAEPQITAMLPPGVSLHTTRLRLVGGGNHLAMLDRLEEATQLLADAQVDRIMFHCTAVSMWSPEIPGEIRRRIATVTDIPVVVTSDAVVSALAAFDARKIVLLTPYTQDINDRELRFLGHHGITVLRERGLGIASGIGMSSVTAEQWYDEALADAPSGGGGVLPELHDDPHGGRHRAARTRAGAARADEQSSRELARVARCRYHRRDRGFRAALAREVAGGAAAAVSPRRDAP